MDRINRKIIKLIVETNLNNTERFGDIVAPLLLKKKKRALLLSAANRSVELLLSPTATEKDIHHFYLILTELVYYLRYLEKEKLIYVFPQEETKFSEFYYQDKQDYSLTQNEYETKINNSLILKEDILQGGHFIIENDESVVLKTAFPVTTVLYQDLMYFFNSVIYPTGALKGFVDRKFISEELYVAKKANAISRGSIIVAVLISFIPTALSFFSDTQNLMIRNNKEEYFNVDTITAITSTKNDTLIY